MEQESKKKSVVSATFGEFVKVFVIAAAIILPVRLFLVQPFYVRGASMEPNFHENEYLIIDKITPQFKPITRGEVVVFRFPPSEKRYLIKRLIGLPGERVVIQNRHVTIYNKEHPDGFTLDEKDYTPMEMLDGTADETLDSDEYYVLGDNRPYSFDSERFGPILKKQLVGRVLLRGLPVDRFSLFHPPIY